MCTHDESRLDHCHDHTLVLHFLSQGFGPGLETSLGARIGRKERRGNAAGKRPDVENERLGFTSTGPSNHTREDGTSELQCAESVLV